MLHLGLLTTISTGADAIIKRAVSLQVYVCFYFFCVMFLWFLFFFFDCLLLSAIQGRFWNCSPFSLLLLLQDGFSVWGPISAGGSMALWMSYSWIYFCFLGLGRPDIYWPSWPVSKPAAWREWSVSEALSFWEHQLHWFSWCMDVSLQQFLCMHLAHGRYAPRPCKQGTKLCKWLSFKIFLIDWLLSYYSRKIWKYQVQ